MTNKEKRDGLLSFLWLMVRCVIAIGLIWLVTIGLATLLLRAAPAEAQDCNVFWDENTGDDLISDDTVPFPNLSHCDENGEITYACGLVTIAAFSTGSFWLGGDYDMETSLELWLNAGDTRTYSVREGTEWLQFWYEQDIIGIVDTVAQTCDVGNTVYPPDNMLNWQQGDSFFRVYLVGDWINVYSTLDGYGELILSTPIDTPACSADETACYYILDTGEGQVNLIDPEGKLYEVIVR